MFSRFWNAVFSSLGLSFFLIVPRAFCGACSELIVTTGPAGSNQNLAVRTVGENPYDKFLMTQEQIITAVGSPLDLDVAHWSDDERALFDQIAAGMVEDIEVDRARFGYRGMRITVEEFERLIATSMENTGRFHYILSFAKEPQWAPGYALVPPTTHISAETPALSVLFVLNKRSFLAAGGRLADGDGGSYEDVFDALTDIPSRHFESIWIFDPTQLKFIKIPFLEG